MELRVALAQFPVTADVAANLAVVRRQIAVAARGEADVVLFPEVALSGYVGVDFPTYQGFAWDELAQAADAVCRAAREHRIWVVVGSSHRLSSRRRPHNCLYVIDPSGQVVERYDKRFCAAPELRHFTSGTRPVIVPIRGVRCGLLICHEWRYPELYREYKEREADVVLHAWYEGGHTEEEMRAFGRDQAHILPRTVQGHAVCSALWVCGTNTSRPRSCFGPFVIGPDGLFRHRERPNRAGVSVTTLPIDRRYRDQAAHLRPDAISGRYRSRPDVDDPRSRDRASP